MTQKDYELIAEAIRATRISTIESLPTLDVELRALVLEGVTRVEHNIAESLEEDDPQFDAEEFHKACEPKE